MLILVHFTKWESMTCFYHCITILGWAHKWTYRNLWINNGAIFQSFELQNYQKVLFPINTDTLVSEVSYHVTGNNQRNKSCPRLIILKSAFSSGVWAYELKFRSKKDNDIIFFSSESWDVAFFKSETQEASRRLPEALFWYEILKFFKIFKKKQNFQIQIELRQDS